MNYNIDKYIKNEDNSARFVLGMDSRNPLFVIGVNPSTADDRKPDATIRRIMGYMQRNGFDGFYMLNAYPIRATFPKELPNEWDENLHKQNLLHIEALFQNHDNPTVLVAFGDTIRIRPYLKKCFVDIASIISIHNPRWKMIGNPTKLGNPRHPCRGNYQSLYDFDVNKYLSR